MIRQLYIDPSLSATGYAIFYGNKIKKVGCIKTESEWKMRKTSKGVDRLRRLTYINSIIVDIMQRYNISFVASELPHGSQSAAAAVSLGLITGNIKGICDALDIPIEWYGEWMSKKAVLGKFEGTKEEMIKSIDAIYNVHWQKAKYKNEAIADAIAIRHTALCMSPILKYLL